MDPALFEYTFISRRVLLNQSRWFRSSFSLESKKSVVGAEGGLSGRLRTVYPRDSCQPVAPFFQYLFVCLFDFPVDSVCVFSKSNEWVRRGRQTRSWHLPLSQRASHSLPFKKGENNQTGVSRKKASSRLWEMGLGGWLIPKAKRVLHRRWSELATPTQGRNISRRHGTEFRIPFRALLYKQRQSQRAPVDRCSFYWCVKFKRFHRSNRQPREAAPVRD